MLPPVKSNKDTACYQPVQEATQYQSVFIQKYMEFTHCLCYLERQSLKYVHPMWQPRGLQYISSERLVMKNYFPFTYLTSMERLLSPAPLRAAQHKGRPEFSPPSSPEPPVTFQVIHNSASSFLLPLVVIFLFLLSRIAMLSGLRCSNTTVINFASGNICNSTDSGELLYNLLLPLDPEKNCQIWDYHEKESLQFS